MVRPVDLYGLWYSRAIANAVGPTLLRAVPLFLVAGSFLGLGAPASPAAAVAWAVALLGSTLLSCAIATLMSISLLWTIAGEGAAQFVPAVMCFLSGMVIPLPFFPDPVSAEPPCLAHGSKTGRTLFHFGLARRHSFCCIEILE